MTVFLVLEVFLTSGLRGCVIIQKVYINIQLFIEPLWGSDIWREYNFYKYLTPTELEQYMFSLQRSDIFVESQFSNIFPNPGGVQ